MSLQPFAAFLIEATVGDKNHSSHRLGLTLLFGSEVLQSFYKYIMSSFDWLLLANDSHTTDHCILEIGQYLEMTLV
jgi:hypothetical protein